MKCSFNNFTDVIFILHIFHIVNILVSGLLSIIIRKLRQVIYSYVFLPKIYSIPELYYSSINLQFNAKYVLKFSHVRFLWSVYIFNCWHNKIMQNYSRVFTIIRGSFFITVYPVWGTASLWLYSMIGLHSWLITMHNWNLFVYIWMLNHLLNLDSMIRCHGKLSFLFNQFHFVQCLYIWTSCWQMLNYIEVVVYLNFRYLYRGSHLLII